MKQQNIETKKFQICVQQVKKLNILLPKGYKLVTQEQYKKKALSRPKKRTIMGLPATQQLLNTTISMNLLSTTPIIQQQLVSNRNTKNTKSMLIQSNQSLPQASYLPISSSNNYTTTKHCQKIPLNLQYYTQKHTYPPPTPSYPSPPATSFSIFSKLKNYPLTSLLQSIPSQPQQRLLSFKQIQKKVYLQKDTYQITSLITDISKLCLKIYQEYPSTSNQYMNTVSIEKYLKSLTKVEKVEEIGQGGKSSTGNIGNNYIGNTNNNTNPTLPSNLPPLLLKKKPTLTRPSFQSPFSSLNPNIITIKQKRHLGQRIKKLPSQCLQQICYILFQNLQNKQYSFDLDTLHIKKIRQLQQYVNSIGENIANMQGQGYKDDGTQDGGIGISNMIQGNKSMEDDDNEESSFIIENDGEEEQDVKVDGKNNHNHNHNQQTVMI